MRDYGKVQTAFWTSADIQLLNDDGKLLALYLLSSPHTNQIGHFKKRSLGLNGSGQGF